MTPTNELKQLVDGMLDSTLDDTQFERLQTLLDGDNDAITYYLEATGYDGLMSTTLTNVIEEEKEHPNTWKKLALGLSIAAAITLTAWWWLGSTSSPTPDQNLAPTGHLATITNSVGVVWKTERRVMGDNITTDYGVIKIESGLLEITHRSGSRLLIEGPAAYEVTGENTGRFAYGKLVAQVPPGAEGFVVNCPDGKVIDLGTEFALQVNPEDGRMEVGVFRGEVLVLPSSSEKKEDAVPLYTGHAVRLPGRVESPLCSIPFDQNHYVRQTPNREMPWYYHGTEKTMEWDVSHLIWSHGEHLAVIKWMSGPDALQLSQMELRLNGELIAVDKHGCSVGNLTSTVDNVYRLIVPKGKWKKGKWTLTGQPVNLPEGGQSEGIVTIGKAAENHNTVADYAKTWEYVHDGVVYRRTFYKDGTCLLEYDGKPTSYFELVHWEVNEGILEVQFEAFEWKERHLLQGRDNLIFINQPYRNARIIK